MKVVKAGMKKEVVVTIVDLVVVLMEEGDDNGDAIRERKLCY